MSLVLLHSMVNTQALQREATAHWGWGKLCGLFVFLNNLYAVSIYRENGIYYIKHTAIFLITSHPPKVTLTGLQCPCEISSAQRFSIYISFVARNPVCVQKNYHQNTMLKVSDFSWHVWTQAWEYCHFFLEKQRNVVNDYKHLLIRSMRQATV